MITEKTNEKWEGNIPALEWMSIVRLRLFPSFVNLQKCTKPSNKCVVYQPNSTTHWIFSPFQSKSTTSKHWEELVSTCFHCFSLVDAGATISILTYTHTSFDFNPDSTGSSSINLVCVCNMAPSDRKCQCWKLWKLCTNMHMTLRRASRPLWIRGCKSSVVTCHCASAT